jgi:hypothetical protein
VFIAVDVNNGLYFRPNASSEKMAFDNFLALLSLLSVTATYYSINAFISKDMAMTSISGKSVSYRGSPKNVTPINELIF